MNNTNNYKWYILELNTPSNFNIYHRKISNIIPKGCALATPSEVQHHPYFKTKLKREVCVNDYLFLFCDLDKHIRTIINRLNVMGVEASILDINGKVYEVPFEFISSLQKIKPEQPVEEYKLGERIRVMSGPMEGFIGNISQITSKFVYCLSRVGKNLISIPFLREDIISLDKEMEN